MNQAKRRRLEAKGWKVGSAAEFLRLTPEEAAFVEVKSALVLALRHQRKVQGWTQAELASHIGSSQSRVAKMESGDRLVSIDLLVRTLIALGATPRDLARILARAASAA